MKNFCVFPEEPDKLDGACVCEHCGIRLPPDKRGCNRVYHYCNDETLPRRSPFDSSQHSPKVAAGPAINRLGPGTQLHRIIKHRLGQGAVRGCGCNTLMTAMDRLGVSGCVEHLEEITDRLVSIATKREWVLEAEDGCDPKDYGRPVPQTRRTRFLRLLARAVAVTDTGKGFIRGRCRAMVLLAIRRAGRVKTS